MTKYEEMIGDYCKSSRVVHSMTNDSSQAAHAYINLFYHKWIDDKGLTEEEREDVRKCFDTLEIMWLDVVANI